MIYALQTGFFSLSVASLLLAAALTGCGAASSTASSAAGSEAASSVASSAAASETAAAALPDGVYTAEFDTDSGMFHANEACDGKGTLTVEKRHDDLPRQPRFQRRSSTCMSAWPQTPTPTKPTGCCPPPTPSPTPTAPPKEVYGYDIPVAAVDEDFQLALLGTKGKWYDHTVSIRNAEPRRKRLLRRPQTANTM